jgi:hypothetical protein
MGKMKMIHDAVGRVARRPGERVAAPPLRTRAARRSKKVAASGCACDFLFGRRACAAVTCVARRCSGRSGYRVYFAGRGSTLVCFSAVETSGPRALIALPERRRV